jgi:predicted HD phosphohydrolase
MVTRRFRQLYAALTARVAYEEQATVARLLNAAEWQLFARMPLFDQRHCLDVMHTLQQAGHNDIALLKAALLHDCGKVDDQGRGIPLIYYGIFVVLKILAPALYQAAVRNGQGLLAPFVIHATHDLRSAQLAEQAGSPTETVAILRDYAGKPTRAATRLLAWADEKN